MAKKKTANTGPVVEPPTVSEIPTVEAPPVSEVDLAEPPVSVSTSVVEVPLRGDFDIGPSHADAQLDRRQSTILRRIQAALDHKHARLRNGRHAQTKADVIRWLLEQAGGNDET